MRSIVHRILLVEDHLGVRGRLQEQFEAVSDMDLVGAAASVSEAVELTHQLAPDVVVLDFHLPDGSGVQACRRLLDAKPSLRILMLSMDDDPQVVRAAITAGARGYILKEEAGELLLPAIRQVLGGGVFVQPKRDAAGPLPERPFDRLSPQERRILPLLVAGRSNKEIGAALNLSENTVRNYLASMFRKLNVTSRSRLIALAVSAEGRREIEGWQGS